LTGIKALHAASGETSAHHPRNNGAGAMFDMENGWYLAMAIGACTSFIVVLSVVHIWTNMASPRR
jgi:hypothetical protein